MDDLEFLTLLHLPPECWVSIALKMLANVPRNHFIPLLKIHTELLANAFLFFNKSNLMLQLSDLEVSMAGQAETKGKRLSCHL